jgi:hypothetical protein
VNSKWFNCSCYDAHHAVRVVYEPKYNEVFFEMRVNNYKNFWKRLKAAFKYLFNLNNRDTSYDAFILTPEDRDVMVAVMRRLKDE